MQGKFGRSPSLNVWASFIDNASSKKIVSLLPLNPNSQPLEVDIFSVLVFPKACNVSRQSRFFKLLVPSLVGPV